MTRYAVRAMADLGDRPKGESIPLVEIAKRQNVKPKYLEFIFFKLRKAKLIKTKRGPGGGYFLNRDPKSIKISEIMEAVGESSAPVFCVDMRKQKQCARTDRCPTRPFWGKLKEIIDTFFDSLTLHDVVKMQDRRKSV